MTINNLDFDMVSPGFPEEYCVFTKNDLLVGFIKYSAGRLTCRFPHAFGDLIYDKKVGKKHSHYFENSKDRTKYFEEISLLINNLIENWNIDEDE